MMSYPTNSTAATATATVPNGGVARSSDVVPPPPRPTLEHGTMGRLSLMGDGMNFDIPSNMGAKEHVLNTHGSTSWRMQVLHVLHSERVEYALAALLFLDILLLFGELLLLSYFPHCSLVIRDAISCCSGSGSNSTLEAATEGGESINGTHDAARHLWRFLESAVTHSSSSEHGSEASHEEEICEHPSMIEDVSYPAGCDEHRHSGVHVTEEVIFYLTLFILTVFFIELNLSMVALSPSIFFRQFFYALDYFVITVSLVLEITFHLLEDDIYQSLSGLLVIFRVWRFIRIGHGIVELTNEAAHREYDKMVVYTNELRTIILQSPNRSVTLPTNYPEMDLFFTNYNKAHDILSVAQSPTTDPSAATERQEEVRLSIVPEVEESK